MIEEGANPFVVDSHNCDDQFTYWYRAKSELSNLPTKKSVYFTIQPLVAEFKDSYDFLEPWFYRTGVFDSVIGQGASGKVLSGDWFGRKAAFKFVEIGKQKFQDDIRDSLKVLSEKLSEMTSIQGTEGSKILEFYGHYRYVSFPTQEPSLGNNCTLTMFQNFAWTKISISYLHSDSKLKKSTSLKKN